MRVQNPRELAASFALAVTEAPRHGFSWIAKNGDESPFRVLQQLLPEVGPCMPLFDAPQKNSNPEYMTLECFCAIILTRDLMFSRLYSLNPRDADFD
jgi:hypothetical protein